MPPCRPCFVLCLTLGLLMSGSSTAQQLTQGSDYATAWELGNPANWTSTKIDVASHGDTVTFYLNPCEWVTYKDAQGRRKSCMPRLVCDKLEDMGTMLEDALAEWQDLATDALTLTYGGVHGGECPELAVSCLSDIWDDDGDWVVTRTYMVPGELDEQSCPGAVTPAQNGGGCLRHYDDEPLPDHTSRSVRECDVVLSADRWDNAEGALDCDQHYDRETECADAWRMELAHELAHGLGFAHSYLTRRTLEPLVDDFAGMSPSLELLRGKSSAMSYDRVGSIDLAENGLGLYDQAQYLYNYATAPDPLDLRFAAFGTVVVDTADNDCDVVNDAEELFGAAVLALEEDPLDSTKLTPVHMSLTGIHPLGPGQFRMDHLERGTFYRLLVADARNDNQMLIHGWDFADMGGGTPEVGVARTDVWSEQNSGDAYQFSRLPFFATGFAFKLEQRFEGPGSGDHDAEEICVEFPSP